MGVISVKLYVDAFTNPGDAHDHKQLGKQDWLTAELLQCLGSSVCFGWLLWSLKFCLHYRNTKLNWNTWSEDIFGWAAAIAQWYHLRLPSCGRWFESQEHHLRFFNFYYWNCNEKRTKINKNRPGLGLENQSFCVSTTKFDCKMT